MERLSSELRDSIADLFFSSHLKYVVDLDSLLTQTYFSLAMIKMNQLMQKLIIQIRKKRCMHAAQYSLQQWGFQTVLTYAPFFNRGQNIIPPFQGSVARNMHSK